MKKNKKGFTLIELLAIIVILAIIVVITVPIILNVIDNAKKGSIKDSAYGYKDAINKYYVSELYENLDFKLDGTYTITDKGRLSNETGVHEIPFTGTIPTGGYLTYENNILTNGCITIDEYKVTIGDGEVTTTEKGRCGEQEQVAYKCIRATELHTEECTQTHSTSYCSGAGYTTTGSKKTSTITYGNEEYVPGADPISGDAFDCDVDGDGNYGECTTVDGKTVCTERFYYVSDLYDSSIEGEDKFNHAVAVLIYYNNTSIDSNGNIRPDNTSSSLIAYAPGGVNCHGPVTAINNLPTIDDWSNVSLYDDTRAILTSQGTTSTSDGTLPTAFSYEGYAARLLTTQELEKACGITVGSLKTGELDTCNYLLENTKYSNSSLGTYGSWLETPHVFPSDASIVYYDRFVYRIHVSGAVTAGLRPVIEVSKTDIEF